MLPASWGLKGEYFDRAEAHYLFDGYDLACRLAEIDHAADESALRERLLHIEHEYGYIDEYERDIRLLDFFEGDEEERVIAEVEIEMRHGKIPSKQGEKIIATLKNEPWIAIIDDEYDWHLGTSGFRIEFDWNDLWIEELRRHGYSGETEEEIVEQWFQEVCRAETVKLEEGPIFNGGGIYVT